MNWEAEYKQWIQYAPLPEGLRRELESGLNPAQLEDRFYQHLSFGTGGLRGLLGAGTNRMNVYTVGRASRGLAEYLLQEYGCPSCAIAYDSRNGSELFARRAAAELAIKGVQVYIYPHISPTPMLSYAVRHLQCSAGIVITASHNPAEYNGYKVYGSDGCQATPHMAEKVLACIGQEPVLADIDVSFEQLVVAGGIQWVPAATEEAYYNCVLGQSCTKQRTPLRVVYSPLNGAGLVPVSTVLERMGGIELEYVEAQKYPDGNFPTCPYPNPETTQAMELLLHQLRSTGGDIGIATDPDCDRVGVAAWNNGQAALLTGNEIGLLLLDYICKCRLAAGNMPARPVLLKTIVTTPMADAIARHYGVTTVNLLTGFKYIGEQIGLLEQQGRLQDYIFGFEESCGYLSGGFVRDKDAVNASQLVCEMAAFYKAQGLSLFDVLHQLYNQFGWYCSGLLDFTFTGITGKAKMDEVMENIRRSPQGSFPGRVIGQVVDYAQPVGLLPASNVLQIMFENGDVLIIRPSGTEPKLKAYLTVAAPGAQAAAERYTLLEQAAKAALAG